MWRGEGDLEGVGGGVEHDQNRLYKNFDKKSVTFFIKPHIRY